MKKRTKKIIIAVITIVVLIAGGCGAYFGYFKPHNEAVDTYNVVISNIKEKNKQLDTEIKKLQKLVDNTDKPLDKSTVDAAKEAIKDAGASKIVVGEMPKGTEDILNKAKELSVPIDYSDKITALSDASTISSTVRSLCFTNSSVGFVTCLYCFLLFSKFVYASDKAVILSE